MMIPIVLVEAKAHIEELESRGSGAKENSRQNIERVLAITKAYFDVDENNNWIDSKYYQLANHLAFVYFLNERCKMHKIKARLLNIYFLNGYYSPQGDKSVKSQAQWQNAIDAEYEQLGLHKSNDEIKEYVSSVFINCEGK